MDVSENSGTPKSSILINRVFRYKPSNLGYLVYFWKPPFIHPSQNQNAKPVADDPRPDSKTPLCFGEPMDAPMQPGDPSDDCGQ